MANPIKALGAALRRWFIDDELEARRLAEEQWRLSEERLRLATETGKVGIWDWDIPANRVTWTGALYAIHGIRPGEFGGRSEDLVALTYPEDREAVQRDIRAALREGRSYEAEFRAVRPNGEVIWIYVNARVMSKAGRAVRVVGATIDIDVRKRMELALRESERRLSLALRAANAGVWEINPITGESFWSDELRDLYGYDRTVPPTREYWIERLHPDDRQSVMSSLSSGLKPGSSEFRRDFRLIHPSRGVLWIHASGTIERDAAGRVIWMRGISIDISRMKQVEEELREADQRKNEFLATLAHELRNPLAPIRNGLEILRLAQSGDIADRARSMMDRQLQQMVHLIDDLLEVSRITRGKIQLNRGPIDLHAALQSALEVSKPLMDAAGHELTIDVPADPLVVDGDLIRLAQVFGNLLNNAAKYTNPGGHIVLSAGMAGDQVCVSVRDNGIGITPAMLPRIFEMFAQADHSSHRTQGGLGIGLSIAKRLVEMHSGVLEARSEGPGMGSEFAVRLPLRSAPFVDPPSPSIHEAPSVPSQALRVLVADDNADAAGSLSTILKMSGHNVRTAYDGEEAMQIAETFHPNVALLDIGMPHLDGYQVCRRLRCQPFGRNMLIVALTGWGQAEDKQRSQEAGFDQHLVKPADIRSLEQLLGQAHRQPAPGPPEGM
jgi:PAS domain S-box-containing protein